MPKTEGATSTFSTAVGRAVGVGTRTVAVLVGSGVAVLGMAEGDCVGVLVAGMGEGGRVGVLVAGVGEEGSSAESVAGAAGEGSSGVPVTGGGEGDSSPASVVATGVGGGCVSFTGEDGDGSEGKTLVAAACEPGAEVDSGAPEAGPHGEQPTTKMTSTISTTGLASPKGRTRRQVPLILRTRVDQASIVPSTLRLSTLV